MRSAITNSVILLLLSSLNGSITRCPGGSEVQIKISLKTTRGGSVVQNLYRQLYDSRKTKNERESETEGERARFTCVYLLVFILCERKLM